MNHSFLATIFAAASIPLLLGGCGASDSHAAQPATVSPAISTDSMSANGSSAAKSIALDTVFAQTISCNAGVKPYADPSVSGLWMVSYDGDQLLMTQNNAVVEARFSTSGHPTIRTNKDSSAQLETQLGETGGVVWFERDTTGTLISAGNKARPDAFTVECGASIAQEWLTQPAASPFGKHEANLSWQDAVNQPLHCVNTDASNNGQDSPVVAARLNLVADGALQVIANNTGEPLLQLAAANSADRSANFVHESSRHGGLRVWLSRLTNDQGDMFRAQFRMDFSLLELSHQRGDGDRTRCVPAPLDPRASITT